MSKICPECESEDLRDIPGFPEEVRCMGCGAEVLKKHLKNCTVFDRITTSPEVLAGRFVYKILSMGVNRRSYIWWKSSIIPDVDFTNREEAFAATLAKLKEVEK